MSDEIAEFRVRPLSEEDETWQERADELDAGSLPAVRTAAERWATGVAGVLAAASLAALLKGPGEFGRVSGWGGTAVRVCFLFAVLAGVGAVTSATFAANAHVVRLPLATAAHFRRYSEAEFDRAASLLAASRFLSLVAVVLLAAAGTALFLGPSDTNASAINVSVQTSEGARICGRLEGGGVTLQLRAAGVSRAVPVSSITRLRPAQTCRR